MFYLNVGSIINMFSAVFLIFKSNMLVCQECVLSVIVKL